MLFSRRSNRPPHSAHLSRLTRGLPAMLVLGALASALLLSAPAAHAQQQQDSAASAGVTLAKAKQAYQFADYQRATDLFSQIAQDTDRATSERRQALQYMGRAYIASDRKGKARDAIKALLKLEPPLVKLNPDVEPPPLMDLYYQVRKKLEGNYKTKGPGLHTVAVMDFTNSSIDENKRFAPLQKGFPSMMINYLNGATDLKVIERERVQWLLSELKLQKKGGVVDQSTAVKTGKLLGAHAVVFGSYTVQGDRMWLSARVVKVETGEILLAEQVFGDKDEFFDLIKKLSLKISQALNVEADPKQATETQSLDAMMAYSDGLALLEEGNNRAAYQKFKQAQQYDPSYQRAKTKAQSLRPMLASTGGTDTSSKQGSMNRR